MIEAKSTSRTAPQTRRRQRKALVALFAAAAAVTGSAQALVPAPAGAEIYLGNGCTMYEWPVITCEDPDEGAGSETSPVSPVDAGTPSPDAGTADTGVPSPGAADAGAAAPGDSGQATGPVNPDEIEVAAAEARMQAALCATLQRRIIHMPRTHNGRPSNLPGGLRDYLYDRYRDEGCGRR